MSRLRAEPSFPVIVCTILERDLASARLRLERAHPGAGIIEIRADHLTAPEVAVLLEMDPRPAIVTVRRQADGGGFEGTEGERRTILQAALAAGAHFIDVEWEGSLMDLVSGEEASRVILSHHGGPCTFPELRERAERMAAFPAALLKIVPLAERPGEVLAVRRLLAGAWDGRLTCFPAGRAGAVARLLAPSWGGWGSYGAPPGRPAAAGQFAVDDMAEVYRVDRIGSGTRRFAIVGRDVFASPSPAMHAAAYRSAGIDACYLPIEVDRFDEFRELADGLGIEAFAVTIPFKEEAAQAAQPADEVARNAGAVNTVLAHDGSEWRGYNTDGSAALRLVSEAIPPGGARVEIRGAGGTARALAVALRDARARVTLFNRTAARCEQVAGELGVNWKPLEEWGRGPWDVLINATPLTDSLTDSLKQAVDWKRAGRVVLDAVYSARPTPLVTQARAAGARAIDGFELLVQQGALQFEHMTGVVADRERMTRAGAEWLLSRGNLDATRTKR